MSDYKRALPFYGTSRWKKVRALALMRDNGMCQDCMDAFRRGYGKAPRKAVMVHHIIPYSERPDLALDLNNLRSLCQECHARQHPEKGGDRYEHEQKRKFRMRVEKV